ncbi:endolytic transglycosylase MltG [Cryobacterium lactosi]|uniref:Endolytic murein transglycosylase n=1 Tax=Cryobacterium lactosi TaxID=1259202 RepID=A0A4R9BYY4_9MICO|nr:endolytic transglycosylase MltG [Cryobacterium lactosi]TFD93962.1 endolytic transglycosylase MltG [Cryobacterium lactosi]
MAKSPPENPDPNVSGDTGDAPLPSRRALREAQAAREAEALKETVVPAAPAQPAGEPPAPLSYWSAPVAPGSAYPAAADDAPAGDESKTTAAPVDAAPASAAPTPAATEPPVDARTAEQNPFAGLGFGTVPEGEAAAGPAGTPGGPVRAGRPNSRANRRAQLAGHPVVEKKSRKGAWGCLVVVLVLLGLMGAAALALQGPISQFVAATQPPGDYEGSGSGEVLVMIHDGDTGSDIANTLVAQDVVKSYDAFYKLLLAQAADPVFQPGAYLLASQMSAQTALDALQDPETRQDLTVVIPEGTAAVDVLASISEGTEIPLADLEAAAADLSGFGLPAEATSLEGFLFPATYTFQPATSAHDAIKTLVDRQFEALDAAGVAPADRWSTIVMASLVQREAGLRDDYFKVARVFYNRLDPAQWESGLLQSDATVAYGTGNTHLVTTTDAERADANNAYNTYVHPGLPVGPISNPGDLAIDAALHPADGTWLFFVTWNLDTGETIFSSTVEEHDAGVAKWLDWMDEHPEYG